MSTEDLNRPQVIIIGAGAAGLFCAGILSKAKIFSLILEKNKTPGKKIIISGGGRCNFTNTNINKLDFQSESKNFHWKILQQYKNTDFIDLVKKHNIEFYEKKLGQLFCQNSSKEILNMLIKEIDWNYTSIKYDSPAIEVMKKNDFFHIQTPQEAYFTQHCILASGGLPMPAIGGSDFGIKIAGRHKMNVVNPREALVPIIDKQFTALSGCSLPIEIKIAKNIIIKDDLLFTHRGLSGPAILKATLYKNPGDSIFINFLPDKEILNIFGQSGNKIIGNILSKYLPAAFVHHLLDKNQIRNLPNQELSKKETNRLNDLVHRFPVRYLSNEGFRKAEVMKGGVSTYDLTSELESRHCKNLFFIGETVDVTGLLGGFNFQWAWSSGFVSAKSIINRLKS